jgi:ferric-dicitrate binding protein FerR (iron transport regulator)
LTDNGGDEPDDRATDGAIWSSEDMASLSLEERRRLAVWIVETIEADVAEALTSGTFLARHDTHATRTVLRVDERGWRELGHIHRDALDAVLRVQAASAERLDEQGEAGIVVLAAAFCCELPADPSEPPSPV